MSVRLDNILEFYSSSYSIQWTHFVFFVRFMSSKSIGGFRPLSISMQVANKVDDFRLDYQHSMRPKNVFPRFPLL